MVVLIIKNSSNRNTMSVMDAMLNSGVILFRVLIAISCFFSDATWPVR
jgi:hypothetical protein